MRVLLADISLHDRAIINSANQSFVENRVRGSSNLKEVGRDRKEEVNRDKVDPTRTRRIRCIEIYGQHIVPPVSLADARTRRDAYDCVHGSIPLLVGEAETNKLFQSRRIEAEIPQACIYRSLSFACG